MSSEVVLLIGRDTAQARNVFETHAARLVRRGAAEEAVIETYNYEPSRELRSRFAALDADRVYAVPMHATHTYDTTDELPAALSAVPGEVRYCELPGRSPAITDLIRDRATDLVAADGDASLVLVGLGSNSTPHHRQTTDYHAERLREHSAYGEVVTCYLMQNPAVECVRYNISNERAVAVPMFITHNEVTDERIPDNLELDRGGIEYADVFGKHTHITDAIHAEIEKQRVLAGGDEASSQPRMTVDRRPLAADGEGTSR